MANGEGNAMKFNCLIRRDTLKNWEDYNPVLKDKELVAVYDGDQLYGYKIGDGRSSWEELNYTNLTDLGDFRIYVDKDDTIVMVNLNPGLLVSPSRDELIPVKMKVASYDTVNKNRTALKE